ncbi:MAG: hypothetical protein DRP59_12485 [Spirochaetes bacterium]|nr:MAG: hypothetical protein DRP59_12485 [Spirochaetota bacterium]
MGQKKSKQENDDPRKELRKELRSLIKDIPEEGLLFLIKQANTILYNMRVEELNRAREKLNKDDGVSIERSSFGRSFILVMAGNRKIMGEDELTKVVRIVFKAEDQKEGAERLFTWFKRNRDDVLLDGRLKKGDPVFTNLFIYIKEHFSMVE